MGHIPYNYVKKPEGPCSKYTHNYTPFFTTSWSYVRQLSYLFSAPLGETTVRLLEISRCIWSPPTSTVLVRNLSSGPAITGSPQKVNDHRGM